VRTAGVIGASEYLYLITPLANDRSELVRAAVMEALTLTGNDTILPVLQNALKDPDKTVRAKATYALGYKGNEEIIPVLMKSSKDKDNNVSLNATVAILKILTRQGE
jgi:HEAT repeat protein